MKIEKWVVREHVEGVPDVHRIYEKAVEDVDVVLGDDEMLLKTLYVTVDPYIQGICLDTPIGEHQGADAIMEVLEAGPAAMHKVGDIVQGWGGWRSHLVSNGAAALWQTGTFPMVFPEYRLLKPEYYDSVLPPTTALGVLGGPGMTAWGILTKFMTVRAGDTVLISGATGTIGTVIGQMVRDLGARAVGTTGSPGKVGYLKDLGFDDVMLYSDGDDEEAVRAELERVAPRGVDKYVDCMGGVITDVVFQMLNIHSEVAICWQYATTVGGNYVGPRLLPMLMFPRATVRGIFSIEWFTAENWDALHRDLGAMVRDSRVRFDETVHEGFDSIPDAYATLFTSRDASRGKVIVKL